MKKLTREIPKEWEDIIDGRSVTLICNSLGAYLGDPFRNIDMYEGRTIRELYEGRAVIFRPHPLLRQTIRSMRPEASQRYDNFISEMKVRDHVIVG